MHEKLKFEQIKKDSCASLRYDYSSLYPKDEMPLHFHPEIEICYVVKGLYALSFGTFGLGIAEFIMMSILPDVAAGFDISLSEAGHLISAYALGVCVGAPLVVVVARSWPLRTILLALVGLFVAGNLLMALSADYWMGLCARFVSGLPHGAYFGVGSIVASRLAEKGKSTSAVAIMIMGMTIANLFGVPAGRAKQEPTSG